MEADLGDVSRPDAIGEVTEIHLDPAGRPKPVVTASVAAPAPVAATPAPAAAPASAAASPSTAQAQDKPSAPGLFSGIPSVGAIFGTPASAGGQDRAEAPFYKRVIRFGAPEPAPMPANAPLPPRRQAALQSPVVR